MWKLASASHLDSRCPSTARTPSEALCKLLKAHSTFPPNLAARSNLNKNTAMSFTIEGKWWRYAESHTQTSPHHRRTHSRYVQAWSALFLQSSQCMLLWENGVPVWCENWGCGHHSFNNNVVMLATWQFDCAIQMTESSPVYACQPFLDDWHHFIVSCISVNLTAILHVTFRMRTYEFCSVTKWRLMSWRM